jgi:hypothetical protein
LRYLLSACSLPDKEKAFGINQYGALAIPVLRGKEIEKYTDVYQGIHSMGYSRPNLDHRLQRFKIRAGYCGIHPGIPRIEGSRDISNYPGVAGWRIQGRTKTERFTQDFPLDSSTVSIKELTPGSWSIRVQGLNSDKLPIYEASRDIKLDVGDNAFTVSLNELLPSMEVFAGGQPVFSSNPVDLGDLSSSGDFQDTVITIRNNGDDPLYIAPSLDPQGSQAIQILTPLPLGPILKNDETELVLRYSYSGSGNHDSNLFLPNNDIEAVGFSLQLSGFIS